MADVDIGVNARSTGGEDRIARELGDAIEKALTNAAKAIRSDFQKVFAKLGEQGGQQLSDNMRAANEATERLDATIRSLDQRLEAVSTTTKGIRSQFDSAFDPNSVEALDSSLKELVRVQDELSDGAETLSKTDLSRLRQSVAAVTSEATATRTEFQQAALQYRESQLSMSRAANQESRERIAQINRERSRFVAESQAQTATALASARRRVEAFRLASRTIISLERSITRAFEGTASVIGSSFRGLNSVFRGTANTISGVFRRTRSDATNTAQASRRAFQTSNQAISQSYRSTFRSNTRTVRNELNTQETRIRSFSREATEEISSIGLGALGGFALLGVAAGRALLGGFERATTLEDSERALTFLLGSAERAAELQDQVLQIVSGTPFKLDQFAQAATQLISFNVEAEKVPTYLQAISDAAALRGGDTTQTIDRLITVFGQISALGRVQGDEILQLSEAGVPALQILGNTLGKTTAETQKLISDGAVPAEEALDALAKGILEGTDGVNGATQAFGGLGKELGEGLGGSVANLRISFDRLGATLIQKFQPALTQIAKALTSFVDLASSAFGSLADAVVASPIYAAIENTLTGLSEQIKSTSETIKPALDLIARGLVDVGTALAGLRAFRAIPGLFTAIAFAVRRILTPMNLLIAAGVGVSTFFRNLLESSPDLREALRNLGSTIRDVIDPLVRLAQFVVPALVDALLGGLKPVIDLTGDATENILVRGLNNLSELLRRTVIPAIERFTFFVYAEVVPLLRNVLAGAVEIAQEAFASLSAFVRDEVAPVVGPILGRAVEIGRDAFDDVYEFLRGTFVPFIRNNLVPAIAGAAGVLGGFALGGPLGALLGGGAALGVSIGLDENFRERIVERINEAVQAGRAALSNLFDSGVLESIGRGALNAARRIGRTISDVLTDPTTVGVAAAAVAVGALFAGNFILGVGEGLYENIGEFNDILGDFIVDGLEAALTNPAIAVAVAGIFLAGRALRSASVAGRRLGETVALSAARGATEASVISGSRPGGAGGFLTGLFGGVQGINRQADVIGQQVARDMRAGINRNLRTISAATGAPLQAIIGDLDDFGNLNNQLRETGEAAGEVSRQLGNAGLAGLEFNRGMADIRSGVLTRSLGEVRTGIRRIGDALRRGGREAAIGAGAALGGAFATSFLSQAVFEPDSSGVDKFQAALGTAAAGFTTFAFTGNAPLALASTGLGLFGGYLQANKKDAEDATAALGAYSSAIRDAGAAGQQAAIESTFLDRLLDSGPDVIQMLDIVDFRTEEFFSALETGDQSYFEQLRSDLDGVRDRADGSTDALDFINQELSTISGSRAIVGMTDQITGATDAAERLSAVELDPATRGYQLMADAAEVADAATEAFRQRVQELNEERLDVVRRQVDEAKTALEEAETAADEARTALENFLTGGDDLDLQEVTDQATINIGRIGESLQTDLVTAAQGAGVSVRDLVAGGFEAAGATGAAALRQQADEVGREAGEILSTLLAENGTITAEDANAAFEPLRAAAEEQGPEAAALVNLLLAEELEKFETPEFDLLSEGFLEAEAAKVPAAIEAAVAEVNLNLALAEDPFNISEITEEAATAFNNVGKESIDGWVAGIDENASLGEDAARNAAEAALAAAAAALGISSPSQEFFKLGSDSVEGLRIGLLGGIGIILAASRTLGNTAAAGLATSNVVFEFANVGRQAGSGFVQGVYSQLGAARSAGIALGNTAAAAMRAVLQVASPSKVTRSIGVDTGLGFIQGLASASLTAQRQAADWARTISNTLTASFRNVGANLGRAIGQGFAESGSGVVGQVASLFDQVRNETASQAQVFRQTAAEAASAVFGAARPGTTLAGPNRTDLAFGRLDISTLFRDLIGSVGSNRDQLREAQRAVREGGATLLQRRIASQGGGRSLSLNSATGQANRRAFLEGGEAIRGFADQLLQAGTPINQVVKEIKIYRDGLVRRGRSLGFNNAQMQSLIRTLGLANNQLGAFAKQAQAAAKQQAAAATAARRAAAAETRRAERDRLTRARFEVGVISEAQFKRYLQQQLAQEKKYSEEWLSLWREIERINEQQRRAAEEAKEAAEAAKAAAAEAARQPISIPPPISQLNVITPTGDPEAVALSVFNRVAFAAR